MVIVAGCSGGGDDADGGDGACERVWFADAIYEGATAAIAGGQLVLRAPMAQGRAAIEVARPVPDGDFDIRFDISSFTAGGAGAFVGAVVQGLDGASDDYVAASLVTAPAAAVFAGARPSGPQDTRPTTLTTATMRFERRGTDVVVTATTTDATATATVPFAYDRLVIGVQLGTTGDYVGAESTATIDALAVTSGDIAPDTFDCDTIRTSFD